LNAPIIVNSDPTVAQLGVAIRYALTMLGGYLVGKGWLDGDLLQVLLAIVPVVGPALYAFYRQHTVKQREVQLAAAAPDSVAVVK